jgi:hypothetical protein
LAIAPDGHLHTEKIPKKLVKENAIVIIRISTQKNVKFGWIRQYEKFHNMPRVYAIALLTPIIHAVRKSATFCFSA